MAGWFPPARMPARRYARELFDLTAGFVYSQIAQALIESGLLAALEREPLTLDRASAVAALPVEATRTLLKAAAALRLAQRIGQLWVLGSRGAALAASPGVAAMIRHHRLLYADLADPLAMLRREGEGQLAGLWRYDGASAEAAAYSALMAASQPMVADQALAAFPFRRHRALLDVGGGVGAFVEQVGRVAPDLRLGLFDRPQVIARAESRLGDRVALHAGSFLRDPLPTGYDLISLVRVLHDHDDDDAIRLLANVRAALPPGGTLLILEPLAETPGAEPMGDAYFGFYLAAMRSGRPRTFHTYRSMLRQAGFATVHQRATPVPLIASLIVAK